MFPKTFITLLLESDLCKIKIKDQERIEIEGNNCSHRAQLSSHNPFQSQSWDEQDCRLHPCRFVSENHLRTICPYLCLSKQQTTSLNPLLESE